MSQYPPAPQVNPYAQPPKTNGMAVAGFVLSILYCTAVLGLIFSAVALYQISKNPNQGGKGLAIAGLVLGIIFTILIFTFNLAALSSLGSSY
mgnify:CR=1 FL=1